MRNPADVCRVDVLWRGEPLSISVQGALPALPVTPSTEARTTRTECPCEDPRRRRQPRHAADRHPHAASAGYDDHDIVEAEDGADALAKVSSEKPDLVLSDWNMPNMTGIECLQALRASGSAVPFAA